MPLVQGTSDTAKSTNISRLMHEGRPQPQAVAIAMDVARRSKRADGGKTNAVDMTLHHGFTRGRTAKLNTPAYFAFTKSLATDYGETGTGRFRVKMNNPLHLRNSHEVEHAFKNSGALEAEGNFHPHQLNRLHDWVKSRGHDGLIVHPSAFQGEHGHEWAGGTFGEPQVVAYHPEQIAPASDELRSKRADGGIGMPKLNVAPHLPRPRLHTGPIHSSVAGRTDHLPIHVPNKAYVLPADIVSGMGEGNTMAGFKIAQRLPRLFATQFYGTGKAGSGTPYKGSFYGQSKAGEGAPYGESGTPYRGVSPPKASGGSTHDNDDDEGVPIVAAGGEHVYHPREVAMIGGGDVDRGHDILDAFVKLYRAEHIKTLQKLPGPKRD